MLTREEDIDAHALRKRGWTISAIARHLDRDRKTVRAYLSGDRTPGVRASSAADWFAPFAVYLTARFAEDPHVWATTLFDEITDLGFDRSYPTFTRLVRDRGLRPACEPCRPAKGRPVAVIPHPAGEETQWDWVEFPDPPAAWQQQLGWGKTAYLLVGSLSHSSRWRGVLAPSMEQPHLIDGLDRVSRALGGVTRDWRFDRMATVINPETGRVQASFAAVAKHYGVRVVACPPRRGNRKGVVEKANHVAAQRFWRTLADDATVEQAQRLLDKWCSTRGDVRMRATADGKMTVATVAAAEPLRPVPATPFPATLTVERTVSAQALAAYRGNFYSVPPELAGAPVTVSVRLGARHLDIAAVGAGSVPGRSPLPVVVARHAIAPDGAGALVRDHGHVVALEQAAMAAATSAAPHRRKQRIPPGPEARAAAEVLRAASGPLRGTATGTVTGTATGTDA
jgi:transposase